MYPVSLGYSEAISRITKLQSNGHQAEALLTSVFTFEKTIKRTLRYMITCRGFTSKQADIMISRSGFAHLRRLWPCFEKHHRDLQEMIKEARWQHILQAFTMRNDLVHGTKVYNLTECETYTTHVLGALDELQGVLKKEIGFDGWSTTRRRNKPKLAWL